MDSVVANAQMKTNVYSSAVGNDRLTGIVFTEGVEKVLQSNESLVDREAQENVRLLRVDKCIARDKEPLSLLL